MRKVAVRKTTVTLYLERALKELAMLRDHIGEPDPSYPPDLVESHRLAVRAREAVKNALDAYGVE